MIGNRLILLATAALLAGLTLMACARDDGESPAPRPRSSSSTTASALATFTATGHLTLVDSAVSIEQGRCTGGGEFEDLAGGTPVVIRDSGGATVAFGKLQNGRPRDGVTCVFGFAVPDVQAGSGIYSIEVGQRGEIPFNEAEADGILIRMG